MVAIIFKLDQCAIDKGLLETWVRIGGRRATPSKEQFQKQEHLFSRQKTSACYIDWRRIEFCKMQDVAALVAVFPKAMGPTLVCYTTEEWIFHTRNIAHNIPSARPDTTLAPYIP
ncbi:MAG: hypothetical protein H7A33_05445 [Deltaproteobacteria bacterium]|nr:hypothetical protein [Deltaproteobacteria bacterium]